MIKEKLKLLDLFSGIGGFSLGLESTGFFETIAFVEKDKFCQKVLKKNFNNIPIEEDIRNVKGERYAADVITGGFPCQPFSIAGKRKGTDDDRYLWDETIRVIRECKPRWFIGENVEGIINIQDGMVLRQVCTDLEEEGFEVQCLIIPASGIGAWHQRKRIWIMAHSNSNRHSSKIEGSSGEKKGVSQEYREIDSTSRKPIGTSPIWKTNNSHVSNTNTGFSDRENEEIQAGRDTSTTNCEDVSNTNSVRHRGGSSERCSNEEWSFLPRKQERGKVGSKIEGCDRNVPNSNSERLQGRRLSTNMETKQRQISSENGIEEQQTWWETQSKLCGVPDGVSYELDKDRSSRIKSLGNSIVPQIARQLGLAIMETEKNETR